MAKKTSTNTKDALLNYIKNNVERLVVTDGEPANYAAVAAATLASSAFGSGDVTGPATEGTGRKNTYAAKADMTASASGDADHVCLVDDSGSELLLVTTLSNPQTVTVGNLVSTTAFNHIIEEAA